MKRLIPVVFILGVFVFSSINFIYAEDANSESETVQPDIIITFATDGSCGFVVNVDPIQVSNDPIDGQTVSQISPNLYATVHLVYKDATDGWVSLYHDGTSLPYT